MAHFRYRKVLREARDKVRANLRAQLDTKAKYRPGRLEGWGPLLYLSVAQHPSILPSGKLT